MSGVNQEPVDTFIQIAQVWSGLLGHEVTPREVALCLAGAKMVNAVIRPDEPSSYEDAHGFLSMSERIVFDGRSQYTVAQANADQSKFYAENDRTKDAGPDTRQWVVTGTSMVVEAEDEEAAINRAQETSGWSWEADEYDDKPSPYVLPPQNRGPRA